MKLRLFFLFNQSSIFTSATKKSPKSCFKVEMLELTEACADLMSDQIDFFVALSLRVLL
jgi:hypothetical protein